MVRIAPNWAHLRGTVAGVEDTGDPSGFLEVAIRIADIGSIPRTRNMFEQQPGETVRVLMSPALVERLKIGTGVKLEADVRRADVHRSFVNPKRIQVEPAGDEMAAGGERVAGGEETSDTDEQDGEAVAGGETATSTGANKPGDDHPRSETRRPAKGRSK